jgi:membrane-bound metal-dependent hydrolase YbcI (DUF457 family)
MAQFGIHALIALYFVCVVPVFSPAITRTSFCIGLFVGSVLPDLDVYASAIAFLVDQSLAAKMHRTLLHSVVVAALLYIAFWLVELIFAKKYQQYVYDYAAVQQNSPNLRPKAYRQRYDILGTYKTRTANYKAFGRGMFIGIGAHCLLDIVLWFAPIDLLFPLTSFGITLPINVWSNVTPSGMVWLAINVSEAFCYGVYLTVLRLTVISKLGKWCDVQPKEVPVNMNFTDTDIEHTTMDYSASSYKDIICPIDITTLEKSKKCLKITKILEVFQYSFFIIIAVLAFLVLELEYVITAVTAELLFVCVPSFCYLAWNFRKILLLKME